MGDQPVAASRGGDDHRRSMGDLGLGPLARPNLACLVSLARELEEGSGSGRWTG